MASVGSPADLGPILTRGDPNRVSFRRSAAAHRSGVEFGGGVPADLEHPHAIVLIVTEDAGPLGALGVGRFCPRASPRRLKLICREARIGGSSALGHLKATVAAGSSARCGSPGSSRAYSSRISS
jgi:hypothetical protein